MKFKTLTIFCLSLYLTLTGSLPVQADPYQLRIQEDDYLKRQEGLSRNAIKNMKDPFGSDPSDQPDQVLQPPPGSFDVQQQSAPPPPQKTFQTGAQDSGGVWGDQQVPTADEMPPQKQPPPSKKPFQQQVQQVQQPQEPDSSAEMQLLWDAWHKRVAEGIFTRFNSLAQMAFSKSPPLLCQVSYVVARDGRIGNVRVLQPSQSAPFNAMLLGVVNSMTNNPVLEFPPGSRRNYVEKTGTFTWNYGNQGFRYTKNDKETVQQKGPGQQMQNMGQPMQQQQMRQPMQQMQQMQPNNMMQQGSQMMNQMMNMMGGR